MSDLNYIGKTGIITYKTYNWPNVCMCVQLLCYEAHEYTEYIIYISHFPDLKNALKLSIPSRMKYWSEKKLGFYITCSYGCGITSISLIYHYLLYQTDDEWARRHVTCIYSAYEKPLESILIENSSSLRIPSQWACKLKY